MKSTLHKIIPLDDPKQALRLRRFFMACAIYVLSLFLTYIFYRANIMDWEAFFVCLIGIPLINVILYMVFRTGLNLRMTDPSLTSVQICIAILVMMYGMYYANEARGLLLLIYVPILLFGIFRLQTSQFLFLSAFVLLTYGIDIALLHVSHPPRVNFKVEYLQWCVLSIVLVILSFMGGYISSIRRNLSTSRAELEKTVSLIIAEIEERKKAQETMAQSIASLKTINTVADRIYRVFDYPSLTREALTAIVDYGKTATASLFEYNENENCLILMGTFASEPAKHARSRVLVQRLYLGKSAAGDAVREKKIIFCEDIATDPRILPSTKEALLKEGRKSGLFIPLLFQDKVMGTINLVYSERLSLKDYELETLLSIGKTIGLAMANVRYIQQIQAEMRERKEAEEALRKSEDKYRTLIETTDTGYVIIDQDGLVLDANMEYVRLSGHHNLGEIIGRSVLEWAAPTEREKNAAAVKACFEQGFIRDMEIDYMDSSGNITPIEINATCLEIDGKMQTITMCRDVTERKRAEKENRSLEERLQRAEKMESLGNLAGGVAHDLNNILGVLVGYSELLSMEISSAHPLHRHVNNILKSGERAAAIIQDLLTLARRGVSISEVVNLNKIIADYLMTPELEALKSFHPLVTIKTDLEKDLLNIKGSPVHLGKSLMNLVSNATEAITGRGDVTIETRNIYLDRPLHGYDDMNEGEYVVLKISDTGTGISAKDMGKIFEPFYTKKVMGRSGTGLGLAVVWGTVKDHHGFIDVQSEESKGSTFNLYFPVTREVRQDDQRAVSSDMYKGNGETILVVDDVKEQRELATQMLQKLGYSIHEVAGGDEAVAYVKENKVDLMILDMIMDPGIDGLETYQRILQINPAQKVIIVSGFSETDRVKKAQKLGAGSYVRKPYVLESIGMAIRKELDRTK